MERFKKQSHEHKLCVLIFFTNFFRNISHSKTKNIGPIFKGQEAQEEKKTFEDGTDRLSRKLGKEYYYYKLRNTPEERRSHMTIRFCVNINEPLI
jgi:hypothetical protein